MEWREEELEQRCRTNRAACWQPNTFSRTECLTASEACCTVAGFTPHATRHICLQTIEASDFNTPMQRSVERPSLCAADVTSSRVTEWDAAKAHSPSQEYVREELIGVESSRRFQSRSFSLPVKPTLFYIDGTNLGLRPACSGGRQTFETLQLRSRGTEFESSSSPEPTLFQHAQQDLAPNRSNSSGNTVRDSAGVEVGRYKWRKYGQKVAKGAEYPRNYYRCKNGNCPALKTEEQKDATGSTAIVYKKNHDHCPPLNSIRTTVVDHEAMLAADPLVTSSGDITIIPDENRLAGILDPADEGGERTGQTEVGRRLSMETARSRILGKRERTNVGACTYIAVDAAGKVGRSVRKYWDDTQFVLRDEDADGYCWRKYGEKIVGDKVKRGYYRCTNRIQEDSGEKCDARKVIETRERESENVTVRYKGGHNHLPSLKRVMMLARTSTSTAEGAQAEQSYNSAADLSTCATCQENEQEIQWDLEAFMSSDIQLDTAFIDEMEL